jgi:hypothetical protein
MSAGLFALAVWWRAGALAADDTAIPVSLQMELLVKVAPYDKNLSPRAGGRVRVLLLTKPDSVESVRAAVQADGALGQKDSIAGLPHERVTHAYAGALELAKTCKSKRVAIVYVTPGFADGEVRAIARALDGADVLTVSAVASFVPSGIVLGFDLVSGKPKLLVHLRQARRQRVDLSSDVLKLMRVVE